MGLYWEMSQIEIDYKAYLKTEDAYLAKLALDEYYEIYNDRNTGSKDIEEFLKKDSYAKANRLIKAMDDKGNTFYHIMSQKGMGLTNIDHIFQLQVPPMLLNMKNEKGRTPLFTAVLYADDYMVKKLLQEGADPTIKGEMVSNTEWRDSPTKISGLKGVWKKNPGNISIAILDSATGDKYKIEGHCSATDKFCSRNTRYDHLISPLSLSKIGHAGKLGQGLDDKPVAVYYVSEATHKKFKIIHGLLNTALAPCVKAKANPQLQEEMPNYLLKAVTPEVKVHPQYGKLRY